MTGKAGGLRGAIMSVLPHIAPISNPIWKAYYAIRRFPSRKIYDYPIDHEEAFTQIYCNNHWGSGESRSGSGSEMLASRSVRRHLPRLLKLLDAKSLLDAPCGDFHWMRTVELDGIDYTGADIVRDLVDDLNVRYARPGRRFIYLDATTDAPPRADVWMCRQMLMHIPNADALDVLHNFLRSGSSYFLATSFMLTRENEDLPGPGFRPLNLLLAPFNLPRPVRQFEDWVAPMQPQIMGLWSRDQVAGALSR